MKIRFPQRSQKKPKSPAHGSSGEMNSYSYSYADGGHGGRGKPKKPKKAKAPTSAPTLSPPSWTKNPAPPVNEFKKLPDSSSSSSSAASTSIVVASCLGGAIVLSAIGYKAVKKVQRGSLDTSVELTPDATNPVHDGTKGPEGGVIPDDIETASPISTMV